MAIDPICGMTVDEATARSAERDGQTVYFCSEHCRQKFLGSESKEKTNAAHDHKGHDQLPASQGQISGKYTCPMHPEVQSDQPGSCPKCGMALEPSQPVAQKQKTIYTCPMHPQIEQDGPGQCPICGMALEPKAVQLDAEEDDSELRSMTFRFWVSAALTVPVLSMSMLPMIGVAVDDWLGSTLFLWLQLLLSTPVVLWGGWPFFQRGWRSVVTRNLNMFTLIAIGTGAAYRRTDAGRETEGRPGDRRDGQSDRLVPDAGREGRRGHGTVPDREHGC